VDSDKIRWAIESFGSFNSAGEDGIFLALLNNGIEILSFIPEAWQSQGVHRMNWQSYFDQ
jgi:hypothetical protein